MASILIELAKLEAYGLALLSAGTHRHVSLANTRSTVLPKPGSKKYSAPYRRVYLFPLISLYRHIGRRQEHLGQIPTCVSLGWLLKADQY